MSSPKVNHSDATATVAATVASKRKVRTVRHRELVARLMDYCAAHGLSDVSLRPLAAAVGSSPRMLLYFFGSKEGMVREVLAGARAVQLELVDRSLREADSNDSDPLRTLWTWLTDPAHAEVEKLFFESYARSLHNRADGWQGFAIASLDEWLPWIEQIVAREPATDRLRQLPTLLLATMRGLLLDLLATGDAERIDQAFDDLLESLRGTMEPPAGSPASSSTAVEQGTQG